MAMQLKFEPTKLPKIGQKLKWGGLVGAAKSLLLTNIATKQPGIHLIITKDQQSANQLIDEIRFLISQTAIDLLSFPDWETLPYDHFSPHQDIISERIATLAKLPHIKHAILIVSITTLMQRIAPAEYLLQNALSFKEKQTLNLNTFREHLEQYGYQHRDQVYEHGEYALRGSIIDLFPMGSTHPIRIELFDDEIETIRLFDPETQRSIEQKEELVLLPAKEFPLTKESINDFAENFRDQFDVNPLKCPIYKDVTAGLSFPGIEYYFPLFFDSTSTLLDYLPKNSLLFFDEEYVAASEKQWQEIKERYDQLAHDITRPILPPERLFLSPDKLFERANQFSRIVLSSEDKDQTNFNTKPLPSLKISHQTRNSLSELKAFLLETASKQILFSVESLGRREALLPLLKEIDIEPTIIQSFDELNDTIKYAMIVAPFEKGFQSERLIFIPEYHLSQHQPTRRRTKRQDKNYIDNAISHLVELNIGDPVVHIDHGVGRYLGLKTLTIDEKMDEYLALEYANQAKLYVPVSSLHLISRYSGADLEHAPLHHLGSEHWKKAKEKAAARVRDVAAELLDIYARRETKTGFAYTKPDADYQLYANGFEFDETPDQISAIQDVISDMTQAKPMDRLICGDVGFGKTEVAMRAAFLAVQNNKQVAVLVPTTLLAQQHYETFSTRFADWPVAIESLSRFKTAAQQKKIVDQLKLGKIDIVIGTHKLIQPSIKFKNLGLLIIDEEHRFGVKQKEKLKSLRAEIDILTLTATPIPRTLNMSISGIRDLSIIATPPEKRRSIKTFLHERNNNTIKEAIMRELLRGGQLFFLHNKVDTIERTARDLAELIPEARIGIAHGQMHERELEQAMSRFYHRETNLLVCTTIIENGIDIPSANTIIIDRADKFGLAQLHQLRGRVGRSHHQAYAYLLIPSKKLITSDAKKRLEAISQLEDLGIGFTLATHDLEIRGAGELLGAEQSGHMQEIGFSLYMRMLDRTVKALKSGKKPELETTLDSPIDINLGLSAIIPSTYLPDVHVRLILYKRIASATTQAELSDLRIEMIDRFGLLPPETVNLFEVTNLRLFAEKIGITSIQANEKMATITFIEKPHIDPMRIISLVQKKSKQYQLKGSTRLQVNFSDGTEKTRIAELKSLLEITLGRG